MKWGRSETPTARSRRRLSEHPSDSGKFERVAPRGSLSAPTPSRGGGAEGFEGLDFADREVGMDIDPGELREFLAGDLLDVQADPVFKERLRRKLWRLVRDRYGDSGEER